MCPATVAGADGVPCLVKAQVRSALRQLLLDVCDGKINFSEKLFLSACLLSLLKLFFLCLRSLFTGVLMKFRISTVDCCWDPIFFVCGLRCES